MTSMKLMKNDLLVYVLMLYRPAVTQKEITAIMSSKSLLSSLESEDGEILEKP